MNFIKPNFKLVITLFVVIVSFGLKSQFSPSKQARVITPSVLSGCQSDSIFFEVSNLGGPSCTDGSTPDSIEFKVILPDTVDLAYDTGSVGSNPTGAVETAISLDTVIFKVPTPSFGAITRVWMVLKSTCQISSLSPAPFLNTVSYTHLTLPTILLV